jgi:CoA:oxalate CoA-transferase
VTGPLSGIRVLDFTWALAGPFATMQLADLGAEVVKVEYPGLSPRQRGFGPYKDDVSTFFFSPNRGKKGICVDMRSEEGRAIVLRLAQQVDVLAENFRPGTMARLGLDYESIQPLNPRLVYASLSGFGQTGPYAQRPAVDAVAQAMGGSMSLNGAADGPPMRVGVSIGDMTGGLYLALGIVAALQARERTGEGQHLDVALMEAQMALCENAIVRYSAFGENLTRTGNHHPLVAPFGPLPTADGYIVVANVKEWPLFCALIERDDLGFDERFATNDARIRHQDELEAELMTAMQTRTTGEWLAILEPANVASLGKVNTIEDLYSDPHVQARQALVEIPMPDGKPGTMTLPNSPMRLSGTPAEVGEPMPGYGQHTDEILGGWLGMDAGQLADLREQGVIG